MNIITPITIDLKSKEPLPRIPAKQGDRNSRVIHLTITDGKSPISPEPGTAAVLRCLKPDCHRTVTECTILPSGLIEAVLPGQALAVPGAVQADIALMGEAGQILSTAVFCIVVEPSPIRGELEDSTDAIWLGSQKKSPGQATPPIVSFVDDDGRLEAYSVLFPWMQAQKIPYNFAISTQNIGTNGLFASLEQLQEMAENPLVSFSCHCLKNTVMTEKTVAEMDELIRTWFKDMEGFGLLSDRHQARTYMYCTGAYSDPIIRAVVSRYFRAGFTTAKGINTTPFDSFHINRVGLFPTSGDFSLDDAKAYVDAICAKGGWLVLFTHCYSDSFRLDELTELVSYIRDKGVEIASVEDVLTRYGNLQDVGCFNKSKAESPYLVTDYLGNTYSSLGPLRFDFTGTPKPFENGAVPPDAVEPDWQQISLSTTQYRVIAKSGSASAGLAIQSSSENLYVTDPVPVAGYSRLKLTGYAISGYGRYSFLDADGALLYCSWSEETTVGTNGIYRELLVTVPEGAAQLILAGSSLRQMPVLYAPAGEAAGTPDNPPTEESPDKPSEPTETWPEIEITYTQSRLLAKADSASAGQAINTTSTNVYVSDPAPIQDYDKIRVMGNATSGYGQCSFLDAEGQVVQCYWSDPTAAGSRGNFELELQVPVNARTVIIAGSSLRQMPRLFGRVLIL